MLELAAELGVNRIVYTSSVGTLALDGHGRPTRTPRRQSSSTWSATTSAASSWPSGWWRAWIERGLPVVVVSPSTPIGERDAKPTPTGKIIVDFLNGHLPAYVDTGLNLVDVRDVALGHLLGAERGRPGENYILGTVNLTLRQVLELLGRLTGRHPPRIKLPHWIPLAIAHLEEPLARLLGPRPAVPLNGVRMSKSVMFFDASKAVRELGFPQSPIEPAFQRAVNWFIDHDYARAARPPNEENEREGPLLSPERAHVHGDLSPARAAGRRARGGGGRAQRRARGAHPRPAGVHARRLLPRCSTDWRPDAVAFGVNYLANIPEVIDLAKADAPAAARARSSSWAATAPRSRRARSSSTPPARSTASSRARARRSSPRAAGGGARRSRRACTRCPGVVTRAGEGPPPELVQRPRRAPAGARSAAATGASTSSACSIPAASIEFTRGCPWDCSFCSAWTFYGRSYRRASPSSSARSWRASREPGVFIVDDVAFIQAEHGFAIGREIERRRHPQAATTSRRAATCCCATRRCSRYWKRLGLEYMFLGIEAIDEEGLKASPQARHAVDELRGAGVRALARHHGRRSTSSPTPTGTSARFAIDPRVGPVIPEIVNVSVNTPYPGTESFLAERGHARRRATTGCSTSSTRCCRRGCRSTASTPSWSDAAGPEHEAPRPRRRSRTRPCIAARLLARGQTNFVRMLWRFNSVFNPQRQLADHRRPVRYQMRLPAAAPRTGRATSTSCARLQGGHAPLRPRQTLRLKPRPTALRRSRRRPAERRAPRAPVPAAGRSPPPGGATRAA